MPYVALDQEAQLSFGPHNFLELLQRACKHIYETHKRSNRGELGEILLHMACLERFNAFPVICKLILKTAPNDTVKGFDGIYVVPTQANDFEIWLGESKFYTRANRAVKDAVASVKSHILPTFLTSEKAMVTGHVDKHSPYHDQLKTILKKKTSADVLLKKSVFPILIGYNSSACSSFDAVTQQFIDALTIEIKKIQKLFDKRIAGLHLRFNLILVPMNTKKFVVTEFDRLYLAERRRR